MRSSVVLPQTARPEQREELPVPDGQIHMVDDDIPSEFLNNTFQFHKHGFSPVATRDDMTIFSMRSYEIRARFFRARRIYAGMRYYLLSTSFFHLGRMVFCNALASAGSKDFRILRRPFAGRPSIDPWRRDGRTAIVFLEDHILHFLGKKVVHKLLCFFRMLAALDHGRPFGCGNHSSEG